jgi:hypothetical protein
VDLLTKKIQCLAKKKTNLLATLLRSIERAPTVEGNQVALYMRNGDQFIAVDIWWPTPLVKKRASFYFAKPKETIIVFIPCFSSHISHPIFLIPYFSSHIFLMTPR